MSLITTLVLACGDSKRFKGYYIPKQFLEFPMPPRGVVGQMWENVLDGLTVPSEIVLAMRHDHSKFYAPRHRKAGFVQLERTLGQADTLLQALEFTALFSKDILVVNCDNGFAPGLLDRLVIDGQRLGCTAALTFPAGPEEQDRFSFVDGHPRFTVAAEKRAIGSHALAGAYYFPDAKQVVDATFRAIERIRNTGWEPYISHIFDYIPGTKASLDIRREDCYDWGTSESFKAYLGEK